MRQMFEEIKPNYIEAERFHIPHDSFEDAVDRYHKLAEEMGLTPHEDDTFYFNGPLNEINQRSIIEVKPGDWVVYHAGRPCYGISDEVFQRMYRPIREHE